MPKSSNPNKQKLTDLKAELRDLMKQSKGGARVATKMSKVQKQIDKLESKASEKPAKASKAGKTKAAKGKAGKKAKGKKAAATGGKKKKKLVVRRVANKVGRGGRKAAMPEEASL